MNICCGKCINRTLDKYIKVSAGAYRGYHERPMFKCKFNNKVVGYYHRSCLFYEDYLDEKNI